MPCFPSPLDLQNTLLNCSINPTHRLPSLAEANAKIDSPPAGNLPLGTIFNVLLIARPKAIQYVPSGRCNTCPPVKVLVATVRVQRDGREINEDDDAGDNDDDDDDASENRREKNTKPSFSLLELFCDIAGADVAAGVACCG